MILSLIITFSCILYVFIGRIIYRMIHSSSCKHDRWGDNLCYCTVISVLWIFTIPFYLTIKFADKVGNFGKINLNIVINNMMIKLRQKQLSSKTTRVEMETELGILNKQLKTFK